MTKKDNSDDSDGSIFSLIHTHKEALDSNKLFVALMMLTMNVFGKYVNLNLPKTVEAYFRYTFSRNIIVFAAVYMGTRDIYIALIFTFLFVFCMDYLFNDESALYILPASFKEYHLNLVETMANNPGQLPPVGGGVQPTPSNPNTQPTIEEINHAIKVLSRVKYSS